MRRDSRTPIWVAVAASRAPAKPGTSRWKKRTSCITWARASTSARVRSSGSSGSMSTTRVMLTVTSSG